ncbi:conserved hypothetical protein [Vibrio phage 275E43-1]|nr:conserved hypothetical protein [Vibrio phage 275E43-1]
MQKAKHSGYNTTEIGDLLIVTDIKERQGIGLQIHDKAEDIEYAFTRAQARQLHNIIGDYLLKEVVDAE